MTDRGGGTAVATFSCGAMIYGGEGVRPDFPCGESVTVPLVYTGQYTAFVVPYDWHIELGTKLTPDDKGTDTLVRCPRHCAWVEKTFTVDFDGWGNKCAPRTTTEGHWEDYG